ncbi:MAG: HlyD family efflux transporter periplasmic adaptor subunit [Patescibacteria group bacterium]
MKPILDRARTASKAVRKNATRSWKRFRALPTWQQALAALILAALIFGAIMLLSGGKEEESLASGRYVSLASVGELSGAGGNVDLIGTVRSVSEANILAKTGGTVTSVRTRIGANVPAGFVIAELENAAERASVLQAEGSYDAAVAGRNIAGLQSGSAETSYDEAETEARDAYRSIYTTLDTTIENDIDAFFGGPTPIGPDLLINPGPYDRYDLSRERDSLDTVIRAYEDNLSRADSRSPETLLSEAESITRRVQSFATKLATAANERDSRATPEQIAALARSRASVDGILTMISASRNALNARETAAQVASRDSVTGGTALASANASVKQALGSLRAAQANLERTVVRAPIGGQVNFLPIRVGDYVTPLQPVALVAQNGALEIIAYVSEDNRDLLVAGGRALVEEEYEGVITSIAPALDPTTKQIEVRVAVEGASELVNGQSVRISLPDLLEAEETVEGPAPVGPVLLPLASVKLRAGDRIVFSLDEESRLVAHPVTVGDVRGDRIEILSPIPTDLRIVADARGLAEGEKVRIAPETGI